jgi:hypothetical protein
VICRECYAAPCSLPAPLRRSCSTSSSSGWRLQFGGWQVVKLDDSISVTARGAAIETCVQDVNVKVILISLKAGGLALNLTAAEMQAIDRAHRIGKHRPGRLFQSMRANVGALSMRAVGALGWEEDMLPGLWAQAQNAQMELPLLYS